MRNTWRGRSCEWVLYFLLFTCVVLSPVFGTGPKAWAATKSVPAGDVATLRSYLADAQPGDIIEVTGTYNVSDGTIATSNSGTTGKYITIRGTGGERPSILPQPPGTRHFILKMTTTSWRT
ncbi:hypothetical protein LJK88_37715 [Paenibacillus sp. P26]|nr:hypothetical protein LJK88_37715 [Paenibacillus sp. P26]UUZ93338.1 hypothetical protein LJK87_00580 [Paenibacillus sp. P25]